MAGKTDWKERFKKKGDTKGDDAEKSDKNTPDDETMDEDNESEGMKKKWTAKGGKKAAKKGGDDDGDEDMECSEYADVEGPGAKRGETVGDAEKVARKSQTGDVDADKLRKCLTALSDYSQDNDVDMRKSALLTKAQSGELAKSERKELFDLLGGTGAEPEPRLADDLTKSLDDNSDIKQATDVSAYLRAQHDEMRKSLEMVGDAIQAMDDRQNEFNLLIAQTLGVTGSLTKSMAERLQVIEKQPARAPKSGGIIAPLKKSFAGREAAGDDQELSKSQIQGALYELNAASWEGKLGDRKGLSKSGHDITMEASKFEQTDTIAPALLDEVRRHVLGGRSN